MSKGFFVHRLSIPLPPFSRLKRYHAFHQTSKKHRRLAIQHFPWRCHINGALWSNFSSNGKKSLAFQRIWGTFFSPISYQQGLIEGQNCVPEELMSNFYALFARMQKKEMYLLKPYFSTLTFLPITLPGPIDLGCGIWDLERSLLLFCFYYLLSVQI